MTFQPCPLAVMCRAPKPPDILMRYRPPFRLLEGRQFYRCWFLAFDYQSLAAR
jgi:hypothetical protein